MEYIICITYAKSPLQALRYSVELEHFSAMAYFTCVGCFEGKWSRMLPRALPFQTLFHGKFSSTKSHFPSSEILMSKRLVIFAFTFSIVIFGYTFTVLISDWCFNQNLIVFVVEHVNPNGMRINPSILPPKHGRNVLKSLL